MNNPALNRLPQHLKKYIVAQHYQDYTSIDQAVWRYIMRQSFNFLSINAHKSYREGLEKTGISIDRIPDIEEMNRILSKIGWGAVCVDGFIPPNAFMEFQAYNVLVIAADIRNLNHLEYTPAPDIVHEAAGHAPIIANPEYAEYLRLFGEIGSRALSSKKDNELYEAIRKLSILKESPLSTEDAITEAEHDVIEIQHNMGELSEMARIRNLHWWTVEYGLIGSLENPKLYGAGLLSSIGEGVHCLSSEVIKIPYSIEASNYSFDITTQQPQLFVTPDFSQLTVVLNQFADTMSLRKGGAVGVEMAIESKSYATVQLNSGIQISGVFSDLIKDSDGKVVFIKTSGPSILCENEQLLIGHGKDYHSEGYSTPVGLLKGFEKPLQDYRLSELKVLGYEVGKECEFEFVNGVIVKGIIHSFRKNKFGKTLLISFSNCSVSYFEKILFMPEWGIFDMALGETVVSVFAGSADKNEIDPDGYISNTNTLRISNHDPKLLELYEKVRIYREQKTDNVEILKSYFNQIYNHFSMDWLLSLEIIELINKDTEFKNKVMTFLLDKSKKAEFNRLIINGLNLI